MLCNYVYTCVYSCQPFGIQIIAKFKYIYRYTTFYPPLWDFGGILEKIWIYSVIRLNDFNFTCIVQLRFVQIFQIFLNTWFIVPKRCLIFCLCCVAVYAEQRVVGKPQHLPIAAHLHISE